MLRFFCKPARTNQISMPLLVDVTGPSGKWRITSKWTDDLEKKMTSFLTSHPFDFYGNGNAPTLAAAKNLVQGAKSRAEAGIPFTRFPVLNAQGKIIGEFAIGFGDKPGTLEIAGRGTAQNEGIGREILDWCFKTYLPELHRRGVRVPVFPPDQDSKPWNEKRASSFIELKQAKIVATVHPDYTHCNHLLEKSGFTLVRTVTKEKFQGAHDGRRNVYEIGIGKILGEPRSWPWPFI